MVLTLVLLGVIFFRPDMSTTSVEKGSPASENPPPDRVDFFYRFKVQSIDSLTSNGFELRKRMLKDKTYNLSLPLKKGQVATIWLNDSPVVSEVAADSGVKKFPLPLKYDKNRIRVGVWNGQQQLIYEDYLEIVYRNPVMEALRYPVMRGMRELKQIALTFDGGSGNIGAREILEVLAKKKIVTTIFITGQFIEKFPDLVKEIVTAGHEVGNHTYDHPHLTTFEENRKHETREGVTREYVQRQLLRTDSLFRVLTDQRMMPYWRAAYGEYNQEILNWAAEAGFLHVGWTNGFDTFDWVNDEKSVLFKKPEDVREAILKKDDEKNSLNGAIILMHLGTERQTGQMFTVLGELIDELRSRGFEPVAVTKLLNP
jgi:peptidoglycan/xylan/chitin deacetylase (PgdA/CDA1 family)